MPIVMYLGRNVNEYSEKSEEIISQAISAKKILCELCLKQMRRHSEYDREIKETGQKITIIVVWCRGCSTWHSLQPDFLLPCKHYSGNEIEGVIIDSATEPVGHIDTTASEPTVRRWVKQIGNRIVEAASKLRRQFSQAGYAVGIAAIDAGHCYNELEQILTAVPEQDEIKCCGNKLGLANIWLRTIGIPSYI